MASGKIDLDLGAVQETLLLPLWARARETQKASPLIQDTYAIEIVEKLDYDFSRFASEPEIASNQQLMWVVRSLNSDNIVRGFLERHARAIVINIGAGLDTTFERVDNGCVLWVNIDLPDVAALRRQLIPDSQRQWTIASSVLDPGWIKDISRLTKDRSVLLMAAGVLFCLDRDEVETLFHQLAGAYPTAHFVFDAVSSWVWVWLTNWAIMKRSGLSSKARLKWHLKRAADLKKWVQTIEVVEEYLMFSRIPSIEGLSRQVVRNLRIAELIGVYNTFHVKFQ